MAVGLYSQTKYVCPLSNYKCPYETKGMEAQLRRKNINPLSQRSVY